MAQRALGRLVRPDPRSPRESPEGKLLAEGIDPDGEHWVAYVKDEAELRARPNEDGVSWVVLGRIKGGRVVNEATGLNAPLDRWT